MEQSSAGINVVAVNLQLKQLTTKGYIQRAGKMAHGDSSSQHLLITLPTWTTFHISAR